MCHAQTQEMYAPGGKVFHEKVIALGIVVRGGDGERLYAGQQDRMENKKGTQTEWWSILLWCVELVDEGDGCADGSAE